MTPKFIKTYENIITTHDAIKSGFIGQALTKTEKSIPYIQKVKEFRSALKNIKSVNELLELKDFRSETLATCGFSEKASSHLKGEEVWFSFITFSSKKHRNEVNKKVMEFFDKKYAGKNKDMPFDMKRFAYGGFTVEVGA